jgi:hypothetical protein
MSPERFVKGESERTKMYSKYAAICVLLLLFTMFNLI